MKQGTLLMTKSDKTVPPSAELQEKIEGLDTALDDAEADFDRFSSDIVAGVSDAGKRVADANDRAHDLQAAGDALVADFKAAGTDADEVKSALDIIRERQGDTLAGPVPEERLEADRTAAMNELTAEGISDADLDAARRFISDVEKIAPGTIHTLEATGSGNDTRLIRKAIAEAKRRGYR
jgi:hypothetical protein